MEKPPYHRKLVTIITEAALERDLTRALDGFGIPGYTITDARGRGHQGDRISTWGENANIRVEVVCSEERARRLTKQLRERFYHNYAMIMFLSDVEVLRPEKFGD